MRFRPRGLRPQFSAASRADVLTASLSLTFRHRAPPARRQRQGQALRVLSNLDAAGRGRVIESAGSGGMPLSPHQGNFS